VKFSIFDPSIRCDNFDHFFIWFSRSIIG